ncbi:MAG TPA: PKD domain-containing protein [Thermoplasmata archaeon]|nr:PKD domain-containing protein [Thermoplasmata archaeon]
MAALTLAVPVGASSAPTTAPFRVTLGYSPSTSDPLLVSFFATVVPGTPTLFNWSFGDGQYSNGSGPGFFTPVHHYPAAGGTFLVTVTVHEGTSVNGTSLSLTVTPAALSVAPTAAPSSGSAPLTVTFQSNVAGGTGTYRSLVWTFGTGDQGSGISVPYTFVTPGHYVVLLNATDSSGRSALGRVYVNVSGSNPAAPVAFGTTDGLMVGIGGALGAGGGAAAMFAWQRRASRRPAAAPVAAVADGPVAADSTPVTSEPSPAAPSVSEGVASPEPTPEAPAKPPTTEALRISQRVVLHLGSQGILGPHEVAALGFTQPGISKALGIRQNALTNVMRRLVAAGVIVEDVRHVQGQPRRLKVYQLTPRGEALARELRHPRPPRAGV